MWSRIKTAIGKSKAEAGALLRFDAPEMRPELAPYSLRDLSLELLARLNHGKTFDPYLDLVRVDQLQGALHAALDVHENRFSAQRYYDLLRPNLAWLRPSQLQSATVVDLGCGSLNPYTFSFLLLLLGAERAYAIDPDPIQEPRRAARALAEAATWLLIDPKRILDPDTIEPAQVIENLHGFDLARLATGDPTGIDTTRLVFRTDSIYDLSLSDNEADAIYSVSVLEHIDRLDDAMESLRRVTMVGGVGLHLVDFCDHRFYTGEVASQLEFLKDRSRAPLLHGSNRLRCSQMASVFEAHGFSVERIEPARIAPLDEAEQRQFVEPYRSMRTDDLAMVCARMFVRKR